jgi:hypothetical protein
MLPGESWGLKKRKKKGMNGLDSVGGLLIFPQKLLILLIGLIFFGIIHRLHRLRGIGRTGDGGIIKTKNWVV